MTRDATGLVKIYMTGSHEPEIVYDDTDDVADLCSGVNGLHFLVDDQQTNSESPRGAVDRITLYDHVLDSDDVLELELFDVIFKSDYENTIE